MISTKILILGLALFLSSCIGTIEQKEIKHAKDYCKDKEGLFSMQTGPSYLVKYITCKNGTRITTQKLENQKRVE